MQPRRMRRALRRIAAPRISSGHRMASADAIAARYQKTDLLKTMPCLEFFSSLSRVGAEDTLRW